MNMSRPIQVIDLFAGPGGLAEGFSSVLDDEGRRIFNITLSAEKDEAAHRTLTLRAFVRQFAPGALPDNYYAFCKSLISVNDLAERHPREWASAQREALLVELGTPDGNRLIDQRLDGILAGTGRDPGRNVVVIGGPPCQAYSLVGRSRNAGIKGYRPVNDERHFLYKEYIRILARVGPAAFVMENVKGMLSSAVGGARIIERILEDLGHPAGGSHYYRFLALAPESGQQKTLLGPARPEDFIVRAERHGAPQARHRVFIIGVREDLFPEGAVSDFCMLKAGKTRTVNDAIGQLPRLRSGLSRDDGPETWNRAFRKALNLVIKASAARDATAPERGIEERARELLRETNRSSKLPRSSIRYRYREADDELASFLQDPKLPVLPNHETRGHMESDLARYLYCSIFGEVMNRSPKASEFPETLAPAHANWESGKFADRFRVQIAGAPSTTITSHISKDGHYFVHPDPSQCRSLTVREAARLQTFPDNYVFLGNRTEQFVQVGNAVPPFLARQIASALQRLLSVSRVRAGRRSSRAAGTS